MRLSNLCFVLLLTSCGSAESDPSADPGAGGGQTAGTGGTTTTNPVDGGKGGATGGTTGSGGATNTGGTTGTGGAPNSGGAPSVGACDTLGPVGQWEAITPPDVPLPGAEPCNFGTLAFVVDPQNPSNVYLGTCTYGVYKSSDCGGTWSHVSTGINGDVINKSRQWTFAIDPTDPQILYTNAGYSGVDGNKSGALKSTNGGVDWNYIWPPPDGTLAGIVQYEFVTLVSMDPTNPKHLLVGFHATCSPPYTSICYGESRDGGATWKLHNADPRWSFSEAQNPYIVNDKTWLFTHNDATAGLWVTTDAGESWSLIASNAANHWASQLYVAKNGYYIGANHGIQYSPDGATWSSVPHCAGATYDCGLVGGITGDGATMWASNFASLGPWVPGGFNPIVTSSETDGQTWTAAPFTTPAGFKFTQGGGYLGFDPVHHILYSSNGTQGFWRVVVR